MAKVNQRLWKIPGQRTKRKAWASLRSFPASRACTGIPRRVRGEPAACVAPSRATSGTRGVGRARRCTEDS
jgi:hypothetical protein